MGDAAGEAGSQSRETGARAGDPDAAGDAAGDPAEAREIAALAERFWRLWRRNWRPPFGTDAPGPAASEPAAGAQRPAPRDAEGA